MEEIIQRASEWVRRNEDVLTLGKCRHTAVSIWRRSAGGPVSALIRKALPNLFCVCDFLKRKEERVCLVAVSPPSSSQNAVYVLIIDIYCQKERWIACSGIFKPVMGSPCRYRTFVTGILLYQAPIPPSTDSFRPTKK